MVMKSAIEQAEVGAIWEPRPRSSERKGYATAGLSGGRLATAVRRLSGCKRNC